jgi:hypothetical protein
MGVEAAHPLDSRPRHHVPVVATEQTCRGEHLLRSRHVPRPPRGVDVGVDVSPCCEAGGASPPCDGGVAPQLQRRERHHDRRDQLVVVQLCVGTLLRLRHTV